MSEDKKSDQVCEICGTKLTMWNRAFGTQKCTNCARGISSKQKQQEYYEFFRLSGVDENSIIHYSVLASLRVIFGTALIILLGSLAGAYFVGFFGAIVGMVLAGWIARKIYMISCFILLIASGMLPSCSHLLLFSGLA